MISISLFYCCEKVFTHTNKFMDDWEKFNEISLPGNEDFHNNLNMEDITNADYAHAKRVCKDFKIRNLRDYHDLFVQSGKLLLADGFENFQNICLKIYEIDPAHHLRTSKGSSIKKD